MSPLDRYRTTTDLPRQLALFPLRGVILLPRAMLPLNVFEPRYLAMLDDVMAGSRLIGIIQPAETAVAIESPQDKGVPLKRIGCAGRVTAYQELPDGRLSISLTGIARFAIEREIDGDKPYRMAMASYDAFAADLAGDGGSDEIDRDRFMRMLKAYLDARQLRADWKAVAAAPLETLVNSLSAMSPFGPEEKQALLEAPDLKARAEVLMTLAEMAIASGGSPGTTLQ